MSNYDRMCPQSSEPGRFIASSFSCPCPCQYLFCSWRASCPRQCQLDRVYLPNLWQVSSHHTTWVCTRRPCIMPAAANACSAPALQAECRAYASRHTGSCSQQKKGGKVVEKMKCRPANLLLNLLTRPSSRMTLLLLPWKNGWLPLHISTVYSPLVPLVVRTSSPLQNTCMCWYVMLGGAACAYGTYAHTVLVPLRLGSTPGVSPP